VARLSSAKAATAVRIRSGPQKKSSRLGGFFGFEDILLSCKEEESTKIETPGEPGVDLETKTNKCTDACACMYRLKVESSICPRVVG
jgi:hypothetical protein